MGEFVEGSVRAMEKGRTPVIAGNWKMNTTLSEARDLAKALCGDLTDIGEIVVVLCPPFISLAAVAMEVAASELRVGAQNMYMAPKGAFTGEVAPTMLQGLCDYVILGHSERRGYFGETDEMVNAKVKAALAHGLLPIVCVGETLEQREAGETSELLQRQVRGAFAGVGELSALFIAYEPIWAIGTGRAATPQDADEAIGTIRSTLDALYGEEVTAATSVLYGGSVSAANAAELLAVANVDGALVGGASLRAEEFTAIVRAAMEQAKRL